MKRKNWQILGVAVSLVLVTLLLATACAKPAPVPAPAPTLTPAQAPAPVKPAELKFSDPMAPGGMPDEVFKPWAKEIEELTKGRVKVTIYGGGTLGNLAEQYNLVLTRTADIAAMDPTTVPGVFPRSEVVTLPLFWKSNEVASMVSWDLMQKYMVATEFKDTKVLWAFTTGCYQIYTRTKPIRTLEDWKGMKIGTFNSMQTEIVKVLGGVPVFMLPMEMYTALERGLIDGRLFDWDGARAFKTPEVTKYRTGNVDLSTGLIVIVMNRDVWSSLPPDIQKIIDEKGPEWTGRTGASFDKVEPVMVQNWVNYDKKAGNPPIYYLPESERARWKEALQPLIDAWVKETEAKGIPARAMLADLRALQEKYTK